MSPVGGPAVDGLQGGLAMIGLDQFSLLVKAWYDDATACAGWDQALDLTRDALRAQSVSLIFQNMSQHEGERFQVGLAASGPRYFKKNASQNILLKALLTKYSFGVARPDQNSIDRRELIMSDYYNNYCEPHGIRRALGVGLHKEGDLLIWMSVNRQNPDSPFQEEEVEILQKLTMHIQKAIHISQKSSCFSHDVGMFNRVFDILNFGVVIVSSTGRVLLANKYARLLDSAKTSIRLTEAGLGLPAKLRIAIHAAACGTNIEVRVGTSATVSKKDGSSPLMVSVAPLSRGSLWGHELNATAVVFLCDPSDMSSIQKGNLVEIFDLTPAEAEVAIAVANGELLENVSKQRGTKITTVRTQMKNIMSKMNAQNMRQFSWTMSKLPPY